MLDLIKPDQPQQWRLQLGLHNCKKNGKKMQHIVGIVCAQYSGVKNGPTIKF